MLCSLCGKGCKLDEWCRLKPYKYLGKGKEVVKGKIYEGNIVEGDWKMYCWECARKIQRGK